MGVPSHILKVPARDYLHFRNLNNFTNPVQGVWFPSEKRCFKDYKYTIDSNRISACNPVPVGPESKSDTRMNSSSLLVWKCWDHSRSLCAKIKGPTEFLYALFSDCKKKPRIHICGKINWQNYWINIIWGGGEASCFLRFLLITNIDMIGQCNI